MKPIHLDASEIKKAGGDVGAVRVHIFHVPTKSVHRFGKFRWMTCSKQWDRHHSLHELVNLIPDHEWFEPETVWECPICKAIKDYRGEAYQDG